MFSSSIKIVTESIMWFSWKMNQFLNWISHYFLCLPHFCTLFFYLLFKSKNSPCSPDGVGTLRVLEDEFVGRFARFYATSSWTWVFQLVFSLFASVLRHIPKSQVYTHTRSADFTRAHRSDSILYHSIREFVWNLFEICLKFPLFTVF